MRASLSASCSLSSQLALALPAPLEPLELLELSPPPLLLPLLGLGAAVKASANLAGAAPEPRRTCAGALRTRGEAEGADGIEGPAAVARRDPAPRRPPP
jgi:hypothetical protein